MTVSPPACVGAVRGTGQGNPARARCCWTAVQPAIRGFGRAGLDHHPPAVRQFGGDDLRKMPGAEQHASRLRAETAVAPVREQGLIKHGDQYPGPAAQPAHPENLHASRSPGTTARQAPAPTAATNSSHHDLAQLRARQAMNHHAKLDAQMPKWAPSRKKEPAYLVTRLERAESEIARCWGWLLSHC